MGKLLTVKEVIDRLRISRTTFYKLLQEGKFKIKKLGKKTLVDSDEIEKYIDSIHIDNYSSYEKPIIGKKKEKE